MAEDKIKITTADVFSTQVDGKLKQQHALGHVQQIASTQGTQVVPPFAPSGRQASNLWYSAVFYMAVFGFTGGLLAWGVGEIVWHAARTKQDEFLELSRQVQKILDEEKSGRMTKVEADKALLEMEKKAKDNPYLKLPGDPRPQQAIEESLARDQCKVFVKQMVWMAILGTLIATFLAVAESAMVLNIRGMLVNGSVGAALGLVGGVLVSLFINSLYQAMLGEKPSFGGQVLARTIGWGLLGLFLSVAPGVVLRNGKRLLVGLAGGLIGGLIGGILFDFVGLLSNSDMVSRLVGVTVIGTFGGVGTGLIENAAKGGWLRVVSGLIAGKQFVLYRNSTYIGSSPLCEIYLFKDANISPRHAAIHIVPGGFELEDLGSRTGTFVNGKAISRVRLRSGDQIQIASTAFVFEEKAKVVR